MPVPDSYRHWQLSARRLLEPLAALMQPGRAELPLAGHPSDHDAQADRLESVARPLTLAAFYLQSVAHELPADSCSPARESRDERGPTRESIPPLPRRATRSATPSTTPNDLAFREEIAAWFRTALTLGIDPDSPHYWGPDASYHQHHVEMGLMAIALQLAERDLWSPLAPHERERIAAWFATSRGSGIVNNNHLFMSVHILEFLGRHGYAHRTDRAVIDAHLAQLETMHRGGGWFEDGINQAYDHYNAYAFHFYGLMWTHLHGSRDPSHADRAQRWRDWARLFVRDYIHFFAATGEHPAFGRSITYRFNGLTVFGLALTESCTDVAPGLLRRLCTRNLDHFLSRPITTAQGTLAPGFTDRFDRIVEPYSAPASPYWAAKGFTPLLLPPTHAFWQEPEEPLPAERPGGFVHVMRAPGLVTRSTPDGEVELLNGGSMIGNTQLRYGAWKWSKLSYRTGVHFTYAYPESSNVSFDSALTQQLDDGRLFGRHSTVVVELDEHHLGYSYNLGFKTGQVNTHVETFIFWRAGWLLHVHLVEPRQPVVFRLGGFALPLAASEVGPALRAGLSSSDRTPSSSPPLPLSFFSSASRGTVLQPLLGFTAHEWDTRLDDTTERRHVAAPYHVTPIARTARIPAHTRLTLAALSWSGTDPAEAASWTADFISPSTWKLSHPKLGTWELSHWSLPALAS